MKPKSERAMEKWLRYEDVRSHIKDGDVLMFRGGYRISSLIKWFTISDYSHAGIAVWWNKRLMVMEADKPGVVVTTLKRKISVYRGKVEWFVCNRDISQDDRMKMVIFAQDELGKSFAKWRALLFGLKARLGIELNAIDKLTKHDKLFCSEYVANIYRQADIDLAEDKADEFTSPKNIADSKLLTKKGHFEKRGDSIYLKPKEGASEQIK